MVALWFGDDTAKQAGRLTLNPLEHIDPFGTIILPVILALAGTPSSGGPSRSRSPSTGSAIPRNESVVVSLAGPAMNIVLAAIAGSPSTAVLHA